ncbi:alpha-L-rhamnosidase [Porphyromonadaceae bacterium KH3CP3RA]|nr:alpha-L-rhamnosidase [Porphyromonadaceae bacterium KH3CP3RA]
MKTLNSLLLTLFFICCSGLSSQNIDLLRKGFKSPPDSAKPGVYWYFMDGNITRESLTKDLESMKQAGIGNLMYLEVNVGVPRGNIDFFSEEWQHLFAHAVKEAERLGIEISLGLGPGWTGSGGPWVKPEESMQHIVGASVIVQGGKPTDITLPVPLPKKPFFGLPSEMEDQWSEYYEDVAVIAFPNIHRIDSIDDIDEKALYYRPPYTSVPGVKPYFISEITDPALKEKGIDKERIIDLTDKMDKNGKLNWDAPDGEWTLMRFVSRNNGASTRPAPFPGLGFESDKFDKDALNKHLHHFIGSLLNKTGIPEKNSKGGLKRLHMDSWEMGAQNWSRNFREEFKKRRGYDLLSFYPVLTGLVVENREISERFLWDLRQTSQELVIENHAKEAKRYAKEHNMGFSIEPYDMNPTADLELGAVADIPMCEFWSKGFGFNSAFSCIEATSIGHINGSPIIAAEAFTADPGEGWKQYPGVMKNQGDWAFANGINRFVYHTFQNQFLDDSLKPGATMGPYGVHWDRSQTWWPMVNAYHDYVSRCQYLLQQGRHVADILFLTPEGAPHVFKPPFSAMSGSDTIPDRRGYNFDGVSPGQLYQAKVENNRIVFPGGATYRILVLPSVQTMTPHLLKKIKSLVNDGAHIIGIPPLQSPGLTGYPDCDKEVKEIAEMVWGDHQLPETLSTVRYGKGKITWGEILAKETDNLYPHYEIISKTLQEMHVTEDFISDREEIRYTHRTDSEWDIYFLSNKTDGPITSHCGFRVEKARPVLWDPITGNMYKINDVASDRHLTSMTLEFEPYQSYFIVFDKKNISHEYDSFFNTESVITTVNGAWNVSFDPTFGGPAEIVFDSLTDWTDHHLDGIKYYSGIATYTIEFDLPSGLSEEFNKYYIDLGDVKNMAQVKLNGKDAGTVWTYPWKLDVTSLVKSKNNLLEIKVANLWINRLIGDENLPDDGIRQGEWPDWIVRKEKRPGKRYTFTTYKHYSADSPLEKSGLLGPVTIKGFVTDKNHNIRKNSF